MDQELSPEMRQSLERWLQQYGSDEVPDISLLAAWVEGHITEVEAQQVELFLSKNNQWRSALLALRQQKQLEQTEIARARALVKDRVKSDSISLTQTISAWFVEFGPWRTAATAVCLVIALFGGFQMGAQVGTQAVANEDNKFARLAFTGTLLNPTLD